MCETAALDYVHRFVHDTTLGSNADLSFYEQVPAEIITGLQAFRPTSVINVYRGFYFNQPTTIHSEDVTFTQPRVSSWTRDPAMALAYATSGRYGYVLQMLAEPEDILFDYTLYGAACQSPDYFHDEELLVLPGVYNVEVLASGSASELYDVLDRDYPA